jgi:hypothetical protein
LEEVVVRETVSLRQREWDCADDKKQKQNQRTLKNVCLNRGVRVFPGCGLSFY